MKAPSKTKEKKVRILEEKVEVLGNALTTMYQELEHLKAWSSGLLNVLDKVPMFKEKYEELLAESKKKDDSKNESPSIDYGDEKE